MEISNKEVDCDETIILNPDDQLIERVAAWVDKRGLVIPAVLYLELHKPLAGLAGSFINFMAPGLDWILGERRMEDLANVLQNRQQVEKLIAKIEDYQ